MTNQDRDRDTNTNPDRAPDDGGGERGGMGYGNEWPQEEGGRKDRPEGTLGGESWRDPNREVTPESDDTSESNEDAQHDELERS